MKSKMVWITTVLAVGFVIFLSIYSVIKNDIIEAVTITIGVTFYHFAMRLSVGTVVNFVMKNSANYENVWFREKSFEKRFYKRIGVRKWKKYLPTYSPETFDASQKTVKELVGATCQAEIVHELIMVFSLIPICLIPFLGGAAAFLITSVLAALIDFAFVILQRYNRPRLIRVMKRFHKLKNNECSILGTEENNI